ncbi:MAG TPA: helicase C-terminal domain-containing protein, partial [Pyrinomonadaceae bacterium]|nr:helicase C-terminal domain-containing protein [Pyrinomonadaceae bacterium]
ISTRIQRFADLFWISFHEGRGMEGRFTLTRRKVAQVDAFGGRDDEKEEPQTDSLRYSDAYVALDSVLHRLETSLAILKDAEADADNLLRRARQLRFDLNFVVKAEDKQFVYWIERRGRGVFLRASPIDVSGLLQDKLFERVPTVVLTSATLSSAGNFRFIRDRLGLDEGEEMIAESIFDFENQAVLYLPASMPDPRSPQWGSAAAEQVIQIVNATAGRAFVLSTSFAGMNEMFERVAAQIDYPCFVQGTASKGELLKKFRSTPNAVLFATSSFWQGVDVRGEQLSCVIIDKLPFAVPSDPIIAARQRHIEEQGGSSFYEYSVPQAIISLKQGLGRLIRSTTDRGVLAVLDPRLRTKVYGQSFLKSLPRCRITSEIDELHRFFQSQVQSPRSRVTMA